MSDERRALRTLDNQMTFAVKDNYLGLACNGEHAVKVCVEFCEDPALAGASFGPEAFAADGCGTVAFYPSDRRHVLQGSGRWMRQSWVVPGVNLFGIDNHVQSAWFPG